MGKERVLSLGEIKKYYNRLGSYLHTQTIEQREKKKGATIEKIRKNCIELHEIINEVVLSPIFNFDMKTTTKCKCGRCGSEIIRRTVPMVESFKATCIECGVSYKITTKNNKEYVWEPIGKKVRCANKSCESEMFLFESDLKVGRYWDCKGCNMRNSFVLGLVLNENEDKVNKPFNKDSL